MLVTDLDRRGLIYWSGTCRDRWAIFVVRTKSGKLRLIVIAWRANLGFKELPGVDLCSSECFGRRSRTAAIAALMAGGRGGNS